MRLVSVDGEWEAARSHLWKNIEGLKRNPYELAKQFPEVSGAAFKNLAEEIKQNFNKSMINIVQSMTNKKLDHGGIKKLFGKDSPFSVNVPGGWTRERFNALVWLGDSELSALRNNDLWWNEQKNKPSFSWSRPMDQWSWQQRLDWLAFFLTPKWDFSSSQILLENLRTLMNSVWSLSKMVDIFVSEAAVSKRAASLFVTLTDKLGLKSEVLKEMTRRDGDLKDMLSKTEIATTQKLRARVEALPDSGSVGAGKTS